VENKFPFTIAKVHMRRYTH